ncbi:MAG: efflux RND transporter permease subunit, partial [Candidatus Omnitrophica bacterium]|nr:efflux RND transporter permease subunit [Candidatus Omnitrophota bacterium]
LITFCMMFFSKLTINVMTLSGLALGVGMLVDNAIVVLDNTFKQREEIKESLNDSAEKEAAILGADEMLLAIVASTATTIIIFLPLVFINPEIRMLYSGIAITITYSLLTSLLVALSLVPMLAARMKFKKTQTQIQIEAVPSYIPLQSPTSSSAEKPSLKEKIEMLYKKIINRPLRWRYLLAVLFFVLFAFALTQTKKLEKEFIGIAEQNKFTIFIEMPTGTRLEVTDKIVARVEELATKLPEVKTATSKIEPWSSKVYVELLPLNKRKKSTAEVINQLRPHTDKIEEAFIYYEEPQEVGTKEILIELYGYDYELLKSLAIQCAQRIQGIPKFTDTKIRMREGRPEMRLVIDKRQTAMFGLTVEDIALALHTHMRGLVATRFRGKTEPLIRVKEEGSITMMSPFLVEEQKLIKEKFQEMKEITGLSTPNQAKEIETIVRLQENFRRTFDDLRRISLVTPEGEQIYLSQVADFKFDLSPSEIWRKNKRRMVQVSANTGGMALGTAAEKVKEALKDLEFPKDYFWQLGGNYDKMILNQKELTQALILSLILVYMIMAALFESFSQPLIILFTVPLAAMGAIAALRLTHKPVGTGVLIGGIMLGGIVVNNAIILIDRINFLRRQRGYENLRNLVIDASYDRLRPIMMTSLTTILGLIPMALDKSESSNLWSPLAITVIGGMSVSTFLTLFVIPSVYLIFTDLGLIKK